jgi:hypothetical protein
MEEFCCTEKQEGMGRMYRADATPQHLRLSSWLNIYMRRARHLGSPRQRAAQTMCWMMYSISSPCSTYRLARPRRPPRLTRILRPWRFAEGHSHCVLDESFPERGRECLLPNTSWSYPQLIQAMLRLFQWDRRVQETLVVLLCIRERSRYLFDWIDECGCCYFVL